MRRAVSLAGTVFVLICVVVILVALPAGAQDNGGIPPGTAANGVDTDNNNSPPDVILVETDTCTVSPGASITLEDGDGTQAIFTDGEREVTISAEDDGVLRIEGPVDDYVGDHATFPDTDTSFDTDGDYTVVSSTGITCEGGDAADDDTTPPAEDKKGAPVDDQYKPGEKPGDVANPKDVVPDTAVKGKKIPDTGGPPYIALATIALLSVALIAGRGIFRP